MNVTQTFSVARPPEVVFDYLTDARNLADWQTSKTHVEQLTDGPPQLGTRVLERTKPPGRKEFEQIVDFTEFERPRRVLAHIVEGPFPIDGRWLFEPDGAGGTRVHFETVGALRGPWRLLQPIVQPVIAREFVKYHELLGRNVESG